MFSKVPVVDPVAVIEAVRSDKVDSLKPTHFGEGGEITPAVQARAGKAIAQLAKKLATPSAQALLEFDQKVAVILHKQLSLTSLSAAQPGFWAQFGVTYASEGIKFRWKVGALAKAPPSRISGGWKDTYRRLWLRADIVKEPSGSNPYALAAVGGEDFWVGVTERSLSRCHVLARAIVKALLKSGGTASMADHRNALKWLIEIQPVRAFELLDDKQATTLAEEAFRYAKAISASGTTSPKKSGKAKKAKTKK